MARRGVTIVDVAREAGVSKALASLVLGERPGVRVADATRERIREAAARLGYRRSELARALSVGRTFTVGLVLKVDPFDPLVTETIDPYQKDVLAAVACAAARAGLRLSVLLARPGGAPGGVTADEVGDGRVDGVLLASPVGDDLARVLYGRGFPAVTLGGGFAPADGAPRRVYPDNRGGARRATEHLLGLGHARIAFVHYPAPTADALPSRERRAGYEAAMAARGLPARALVAGDLPAALAGAAAAADRPTALCCFNDALAARALDAARAAGLGVPGDLSVTGFDNGALASATRPPLTTVRNPVDALAEAAIGALQSLWRGEEPDLAPLPTELVVRESTGPPPARRSGVS